VPKLYDRVCQGVHIAFANDAATGADYLGKGTAGICEDGRSDRKRLGGGFTELLLAVRRGTAWAHK
jgi:hypothetical protein